MLPSFLAAWEDVLAEEFELLKEASTLAEKTPLYSADTSPSKAFDFSDSCMNSTEFP